MSDLILVQENSTPETVELVSAGPQGPSGTFTIGTITTGLAGSSANVTNTGTPSQAVLNFTIPRGDVGDVTPEATAAKNAAQSASSAAADSQVVASNAATSATASASSAQQSATAAASSSSTAISKAAEASTSAASAASSESVALGASSTATLKASEAGSFATAASTSAASSETSANASASYAAAASGSANASATSAGNASGSASLAQEWATKTISEVALGQGYGAKKYALDAASMAAAAEIAAAGSLVHSQTAAGHSQSASTSADNANTSASVSSDASVLATLRAGQAAESASTSSSQAANASASAATATTQASSATASASTASTQAGIATTKASEAATSASAASVSAAAALASQTASAGSAAAANTSAGSAAGSASSALAIYGTTNAQQAALVAAQSAASLAQGFALSASSAVQQDLSGVTAQALHRSPNAVTAMFVYDTSKDSDGGAWTEKCQHTSWYNEALNGKWLGAWSSEFEARNAGATLGVDLVTNGSFATDTAWTKGTGWTINNGAAIATASSDIISNTGYSTALPANKTVVIQFTISGYSGGTIRPILAGGTAVNGTFISGNGTFTQVLANTTNLYIRFGTSAFTGSIDNISVREVTALTTASGDYYQSTVDGKFYRLWKNLLPYSEQFPTVWSDTSLSVTQNATTTPDGLSASLINYATGGRRYYFVGGIVSDEVFTCRVKDASNGVSGVFGIALIGAMSGGFLTFNTITGVSSDTAYLTAVANGDGWWNVTVKYRVDTTSSSSAYISIQGGSGQVYITRLQRERGSVATAYERKTVADGSITETFRGNKADFPRLAGIVAEAANVTIYDLTEAGRPMWMRFVGGSSGNNYNFLPGIATPSSIFAINGLMDLSYGANGLIDINFGLDRGRQIYSGGVFDFSPNRMSSRNSLPLRTQGSTQPAIVNNTVNAVAMTVLPDAPVDAVTGLQVPTIAVATNAGVSVIKHNGTVVNIGTANTQLAVSLVAKEMFVSGVNGTNFGIWYCPDITATTPVVAQYYASFGTNLGMTAYNDASPSLAVKSQWVTRAGGSGLRFMRRNPTAVLKPTVAAISNTFNTGHLIGDIRRAYLSDVDVGSVSGTELVTNGTFDTDLSGWTNTSTGSGSATYSGGTAALVGTDAANRGMLTQQVAVTAGKAYRVTYTISRTSGALGAGFVTSLGTVPNTTYETASGTFSYLFIAPASNCYFAATSHAGGGNVSIDNISIREAVYDRSYKASGAGITGTLTKTQVAAASQLVAYSGFSAANYLREPYSADLDFGTGEWSASAWVNVPVTISNSNIPTTGANKITNGTFDTNLAGWNLTGNAGAVVEGGELGLNYSAASNGIYQTITGLVVGRRYKVTGRFKAGSTAAQVLITGSGSTIPVSGQAGTSATTFTSFTIYFTAIETSHRIYLQVNGISGSAYHDDIEFFELADLPISERAYSSGSSIRIGVNATGTLTATAFDGTTTRTVTTTAAYNTATWIKPEAVYTTDGTLAIRVNGVEVAATRGTPLLTLNNASAVLTIGNSYAADAPFPGSISLLKLSATVPTAEQSQWMYEQEKQMFRDGAQVTLPDAGSIVDLTYDDATDKWIAVSATNESEWSGLVRTSVMASPAGSYTKVSAASGVQLQARSTTNPGVDITIPSYGLREELVRRSESAARLARNMVVFDYVGGFTANTITGSTAIASVASLTYPVSYVGARISGAGIPANTTVVAVSGTTIYISAAATATASGVQISFVDFTLPVGYEAKNVFSAGATKVEGATKDFTRLFDGFKETIRFGTAPGFNVPVQIQATRSVQ